MKIKANGRLRHCFWGTYQACIVLMFESELEAGMARPCLPGWKPDSKDPKALVYMGPDPELTLQVDTLVRHGAERDKITSLAKSIDYGEPFTCGFEVAHPDQQELF